MFCTASEVLFQQSHSISSATVSNAYKVRILPGFEHRPTVIFMLGPVYVSFHPM